METLGICEERKPMSGRRFKLIIGPVYSKFCWRATILYDCLYGQVFMY